MLNLRQLLLNIAIAETQLCVVTCEVCSYYSARWGSNIRPNAYCLKLHRFQCYSSATVDVCTA